MNATPDATSILIVDDEPSNLLALEAILAPLGQRLVRASSGEEALWRALEEDFALVLLDVQMPKMDGFECAELLRARPSTRYVPIIFLTAISKGDRFVARGYDAGAVDYLLKPYDPDILRSKVRVFVELAQKNALIREQHEELRRIAARELEGLRRSSEKRYTDLADSMPQIVWAADADGRITYANRRWRELAGGALEFSAVVHPEDVRALQDGWQRAIASGARWEGELRFGNATAGYRFHLVRAVPHLTEAARIDSWIGTSTDIHERVRAHASLRLLADASLTLGRSFDERADLEGVLRTALPLLGEAAVLAFTSPGEHGRITAGLADLASGLFDDPRVGFARAVQASGSAECCLDVAASLESAPAQRDGSQGAARSGELALLRDKEVAGYMCVPLAAGGVVFGTLTFVTRTSPYEAADVGIAEDLGRRIAVAVESRRLHDAMEQRRHELEEANRSKDVFLATLSHELRTPLNAIVGFSDMLRRGDLSGEGATRASETIDRNAHALSHLVADLLDVSRIVTGALKVEVQPISLRDVVSGTVEGARLQCDEKGVSFDVRIDDVGIVLGDAERLRQVVLNLLSNAVKFTRKGGVVSLRLVRDGERAHLVVRDSGEGIDKELLPHVFERFRQSEAARTRGLGLGLAIVKHLVERHGGQVRVESEGKGRGTTVTVELPISTREAEVGRAADREGAARPPDLHGVDVLFVEDDPDGSELVTMILERYGAEVRSVSTAAAALEALDERAPSLIVSDIGLPDMDGIELMALVRTRPGGADIPAVALTAYASRQDAARTIAAGFDAHVAKPVQAALLGSEIARVLLGGAGKVHRGPTEQSSPGG